MPARSVARLLTAALTAVVALGAAMPHTSMEHITLQLQPEMLTGHRLVLTLEPLPDPSTPKSLNSNQTLANSTLEGPTTTQANDEDASTTPTPDATTENPEETTATFVSPIVKKTPFSLESDVDGLLITIPDVVCPQGFRLDLLGKCRAPFRPPVPRGRSFSGLLSPYFGAMRTRENGLSKLLEKLQMHPDGENNV